MNIQSLNKTQRKRLLNLCEEFFPSCDNIRWCNSSSMNINTDVLLFYKNSNFNIHWYQLCLTILADKIWNKLKPTEQLQILQTKWFMGKNVIDYHNSIYLKQRILTGDINNQDEDLHPVDFLYAFVEYYKKNKYFK